MLVLFVATLAAGLFAFSQLNIEAYPDPTPPMVDVITQSAGLSAEEVERYITIRSRHRPPAYLIFDQSERFRFTDSPT